MTGGIVIGLLLAAVVVAYVAAPLLRSSGPESERLATHLSERRELKSKHDMVLGALKDLEDDRATDKIGEADYDDMKARLSARAIEVMKRLDALVEREQEETRPGPRSVPRPDPGSAGPSA